MPATALNVGEKFSALDGLHLLFLPVVAAFPAAPSRAEINAGTDLTTEISSWEGFELDPQTIETPSLARFTGSIPGRINLTSGVLNMYADRGNDDVRDVLPDGTTGYIVFMDSGDVPTKKMDVWPVRVNRLSKVRSMEAATMLKVAFTHNELPREELTIPAAT
jgi:hypothetical protein